MNDNKEALKEAIELLCSAHEIASREGRDTNWSLFKESLRKLLAQYGRNGITPRTYRIVHGGVSAIGLIPGHES